MTKETLVILAEAMGLDTDEWISDSDIIAINLGNDGIQQYDQFTQDLYIDSEGILKVKYYASSIVSSVFKNIEIISDTTLNAKTDIFGNYGVTIRGFNPFRNPKVGDIVYTIKSDGSVFQSTFITAISGNTLELNGALDFDQAEKICYASGNLFNVDLTLKDTNDKTLTPFDDNAFILYKRPLSLNPADIYISAQHITGFSMRRGKDITELYPYEFNIKR